MQLLTMGAESNWRSLRERAFAARLKRLKELDGATAQAMRALSRTSSTVRVLYIRSITKSGEDPATARRVRHWVILVLVLGGRMPAVFLREDGMLVRIVGSDELPAGWTVPIDLRELSLWRIDRIIRKLKKIGARG